MKKLLVLLVLIVLCSCSTNSGAEINDNSQIDNIDENTQEENTIVEAETSFEEYSLLIITDVIKKRSTPSTENNDNKVGLVYMGEIYTVYEEKQDNDYIWRRVGENEWIADDGTWCVKLSNSNEAYPYVLSNDEKDEFLLSLYTGGRILSSRNKSESISTDLFFPAQSVKNSTHYQDSAFNCDIIYSIWEPNTYTSYKYNVDFIVKNGENSFDLYIFCVENNEYVDYSVGCLKITDVGTEYVGDGSVESICFDATIIKNNNKPTDPYFENLYNTETHYTVGQTAY